MSTTVLLASLAAIAVADAAVQRWLRNRLQRVLHARTQILQQVLGDPDGQISPEEIAAAREALEHAVRRFAERGVRERLAQEERRA